MAYVAKGAIDCFQMDGLQPWDVAAGMIIVTEAGGTLIDSKGTTANRAIRYLSLTFFLLLFYFSSLSFFLFTKDFYIHLRWTLQSNETKHHSRVYSAIGLRGDKTDR